MNDVEHRLGTCRPAGPPPDLRARILEHLEEARPATLREWLPAIAAAAVIALFLAWNHQLHAELDRQLAVDDDIRAVEQWLPVDAGAAR
jgi:predicted NAD/FAD-dependent oxidoreductase